MPHPARAIEAPLSSSQPEFTLDEAEFRTLARVAYQSAGIALSDTKRQLVYGRLSRRLRSLGLASFREYLAILERNDGGEIERFINSISTNHTKFFRENHHFEHLQENFGPSRRHAQPGAGPLKIWSAGCSSGEEPYTIAAVLQREFAADRRGGARILATDIDTDVLARAAAGQYEATAIEEIPQPYRQFFKRTDQDDGKSMQVSPLLRDMIVFKHFNFMAENWPMKGPFDAIFCRNVMIYFDSETKARLVDRFTKLLKPDGWLYIGHSESLLGTHHGLQLMGRTIYKRVA